VSLPDRASTRRTPRLLLLIAAALLALGLLSACGSSDDSGGGGAAAAASTTAGGGTASGGSSGSSGSGSAEQTITVGVPRNFGYLSTLWARDVQPPGVRVEYKYFPVFTDMLTALNSGKIDLTEIGDVGAVQSYVNGGKVEAVAVTQPNDLNCGLLVPRDSPVRTFADLKGKKLAFLRSTNSYISFLHQIKEAGLKESDFQIVEISGPAANKAFQTGQVDGYYTIDPNMADLIQQTGAREIATCRDMGTDNLYPYVATTDAIKDKPQAIRAVIQAVADNIAWIQAHPDEQARLVAPKLGFSESSIRETYARGARGLQTVDDAFYAHEQPVIDELVAARIVTRPVRASDVFLSTFDDATTPSADATR
jgi:sulfonate transport system substrate-binding protein